MNRWHSLPAELYALVEQTPATVLLESTKPGAAEQGVDGWTRLFVAPTRVCAACEATDLPALFAEIERAVSQGYFAAGYFRYECGSFFEPKAGLHRSQPGLAMAPTQAEPLAWFGIYDRCHRFDHRRGVFVGGDPPGLTQLRAVAPSKDEPALDCSLEITEPQYAARIEAIHEWIRAGDVYQLNFTVPLHVHAPGSPAALYRRLSQRQPVPYGVFLHGQPNRRILSFSPELFFQLEEDGSARRILTRPMKGTAPRGRTTREDRELAEWLRNDPKNRAENLMIVDLVRNDLGRLCSYGSVRAENLFAVERYPTLQQMTSTVRGEVRAEIDFQQIFRALFPCGSITGAPKVRAMQLIGGLEKQPRGVYTGAIGFFSKEQTIFNVAIRTLELDGEQGAMGIGSGIVIDSDPAQEYRECLLKADFLTTGGAMPEHFELLESLLWRDGYPLLDLHLDRLEDSAHYFGFACDRDETRAALLDFARSLAGPEPRKVRLLLDRDGGMKIESLLISPVTIAPHARPLRVRISPERTDSRDPMLFHKTTYRPLYAPAWNAAIEAGYGDVLFLNQRGEVTESARSNIFIEKDGRLLTPPVDCGLLAGVERRRILEADPNAEERILTLDDLHQADAVYLSNAIRGLRRAAVDYIEVTPVPKTGDTYSFG